VYYFVIGEDGGRYGPADIDTLVQWANEGRLLGATTLIELGSERSMRADSITAIAVALRRLSGEEPAVVIERDDRSAEIPTVTRIPPPPGPPFAGTARPVQPPVMMAVPAELPRRVGPKSKIVAGVLGILLGGFGVHRFYLGYIGIGLVQLFLGIMICGWPGTLYAAWIWGFVEGIVCLCGGMRDRNGLALHD
jgi:TM2 domain-containing membrane protein YozV